MEKDEQERSDALDEAIRKSREVEGRVAYASSHPLMKIKPILKKSRGPCPKVACIGCHNYDSHRTLGYTCLIKGTSRQDPTKEGACCYTIAKGQTTLMEVGN